MKLITTAEIKQTIAELLSQRFFFPYVLPSWIEVEEPGAGWRFHFTIRLNRNFKVLPPAEASKRIYEQTGQKAEGVWYLLFGSLTLLGGRLRVHVRTIFIETSEIKRVAHADGEETAEGLKNAFENAFARLGVSLNQ